MGGPEGKIFGSRSGRTGRAHESQIFSRPSRPYSVNKHFIIWPLLYCWKFWKFCLRLNRKRLHKIRRLRAQNNYMSFYHKNLSFISSIFSSFYFFASNKKLTIHRKTQLMQFMLKSQQKVDIKLSKICQSHQQVASRFTEIVVKTHENVGVVSSYLSGYLSTSWILLSKGQPATEF